MATLASDAWADNSLHRSPYRASQAHCSDYFSQPHRPVTPRPQPARKVSAKRKRVPSYAASTHPLQSSPLATPYVPYKGAPIQRLSSYTLVAATPSPLVCERYRVAPGQETPDMSTTVMAMHINDTPELSSYRSSWQTSEQTTSRRLSGGPLERDVNGRSRTSPSSAQGEQGGKWTGAAFGLVGGVASFIFRMLPSLPTAGNAVTERSEEQSGQTWQPSRTPLPGMYPEDSHYAFHGNHEETPVRPVKRLQLDSARSWVMVDRDQDHDDGFEDRLSPRKISSNMAASLDAHLVSTASMASSRQSLIPQSRASSSQVSASGSPAPTTYASILPVHKRRASTASVRSPARSPARTPRPRRSQQSMIVTPRASTPDLRATSERDSLTPEAFKYLQQRERRDRDAQRSMRKMSKQVQDLIRQGQQALGANFEVDQGSGSDIEL